MPQQMTITREAHGVRVDIDGSVIALSPPGWASSSHDIEGEMDFIDALIALSPFGNMHHTVAVLASDGESTTANELIERAEAVEDNVTWTKVIATSGEARETLNHKDIARRIGPGPSPQRGDASS
jgi:hypothetical protein